MSYKKLTLWSDNRARFIDRIATEMRRLQSLKFRLIGFPVWDPAINKWNAAGITVSGVDLFEIGEPIPIHKAGAELPKDCVWFVRLGPWAQWWLNVSSKVWLGPVPVELVEFDHRRNRGAELLAKKIAMNSLLLWSAIRSRLRIERRVESLLEDIGEMPPRSARNAHWAGRMRDRFDDAMMLLEDKGLVEKVIWNDRFGPGASDRCKGWVEPWLASKVVFERPSRLYGELQTEGAKKRKPHRKHRKALRSPPTCPETKEGFDIRSRRSRLNISQVHLARAMGLSPSYLSQVETGHINASNAFFQKADDYLAKLTSGTGRS